MNLIIINVVFIVSLIVIIIPTHEAKTPPKPTDNSNLTTLISVKPPKPLVNPLNTNHKMLLETYIVHVPAVNQPAVYSSKKAWHQGLLSLAEAAATTTTYNGNVTAIPSIRQRLMYSYGHAYQGFAARLTKEEAAALSKMPEVKTLFISTTKQLHTTHSPEFLNLFTTKGAAISNPGPLFSAAKGGSDVIVGLIDTGVWPESASFNDDTGFTAIPTRWNGSCADVDTFNGTVVCNKKLIGARAFYQGIQAYLEFYNLTLQDIGEFESPRDRYGHGTHTASTSVGNVVQNAGLFNVYANGTASGMAPSARLAVYKVCWWSYGCDDVDIIAGFDAAVNDGVDIISISVGGLDFSYDTSSISLASFNAVEQGVTVVASAGNWGPSRWSVVNAAPWIVTVGASSVDRDFPATVTLGNGTIIEGSSLYAGDVDLSNMLSSLVYGGYCSNATELVAMGDVVQGAVLLCDYSDFVLGSDKGFAVKQAGGVGMVLWNYDNDVWSSVESFTIPTIYVRYDDGLALNQSLASGTGLTVKLQTGNTRVGKSVVVPAPSLASFSSRGPNWVSPQLIKPDVIAPGVSILASWSGANGPSFSVNDSRRVDFDIVSGTSMSCPHVAGIVALLKAAHPTWTPAMLRSAITTTATTGNNRGDSILQINNGVAATAVDLGAGHINPNAALDPGLVYDATAQDYVDFLCSLGYNISSFTNSLTCNPNSVILNPGDLNYPSFSVLYYSNNQTNSFTYTRSLTNVAAGSSIYTVSVTEPYGVNVTVTPSTLSFNGTIGEKQSYSVTFTGDPSFFSLIVSGYTYSDGSVTWSDNAGHSVRSPILFLWGLVST